MRNFNPAYIVGSKNLKASAFKELRLCLQTTEPLEEGGNRPLRACGTRFISHKVAAIGCLLDRYGTYIAHLTEHIEDSCTNSADKQKLKGYVKKWCDSKVLGFPLFYDILSLLQPYIILLPGHIKSLCL